MNIRVTSTIGELADDLRTVAVTGRREMARVVRKNIAEGNRLAKGFARQSAGAHGKHYHRAFSAEMTGATSGTYGPDASMPQGDMSFEGGSRNQPPHLDLAQSADIIKPKFIHDVDDMLDHLFWPGAS